MSETTLVLQGQAGAEDFHLDTFPEMFPPAETPVTELTKFVAAQRSAPLATPAPEPEDLSRSPLERVKFRLGSQLILPQQVVPPPGLATGWPQLDRYLLWHGFPKGSVSMLMSEAGGATTLWQQCAAPITQRGQWVAWVNGPDTQLTPWSLRHRKVNLERLLNLSHPQDSKQTLWALQELMSLSLFELIGCDLGAMSLSNAQILKLKKLAQVYHTGLVLFTSQMKSVQSPFYSLILHFQKDHVIVHRALHRPTPHTLERRALYADTLPQLAAGRRALCG